LEAYDDPEEREAQIRRAEIAAGYSEAKPRTPRKKRASKASK